MRLSGPGTRLRFSEMCVVALAMTLAWGLRGQHGHEKGSALAGAMVGLSLAAVTMAANSPAVVFALRGELAFVEQDRAIAEMGDRLGVG